MKKIKKAKKQQQKETSIKKESFTLPPCGLAEDILEIASAKKKNPAKETQKPPVYKNRRANDENLEENQIKIVTFFLDSEEYGLPISQVQEINRVAEITRLPNTPEHVKGVINLRGKIIPVIELKRRLQLGDTKLDKNSRIVLVEHSSEFLGLVVDSVSQVINIPFDQIEEAPEEAVRVSENFIKGIGKVGERMIILLELDQIVQDKVGKVV